MDMQMYNLVKAAIKDGKSIEDVVAEVNALAQTAEKELKPQTPLKDKYSYIPSTYIGVKNLDGTVNRNALITAIAFYYIQKGMNPDICFEDEKDFREHIARILDNGLASSKAAEKIYQMSMNGASDGEVLKTAFESLGDIMSDIFAGRI